eukprot:scaffold15.g4209.t1
MPPHNAAQQAGLATVLAGAAGAVLLTLSSDRKRRTSEGGAEKRKKRGRVAPRDLGAQLDGAGEGAGAELLRAARESDAAAVQLALQAGAPANAADLATGRSALMLAAEAGNALAVRQLLDYGAAPSVNARDLRGDTALALAAAGGHAVVVDQLLEAGADAGTANGAGETAYSLAAARLGADAGAVRRLRAGGGAGPPALEAALDAWWYVALALAVWVLADPSAAPLWTFPTALALGGSELALLAASLVRRALPRLLAPPNSRHPARPPSLWDNRAAPLTAALLLTVGVARRRARALGVGLALRMYGAVLASDGGLIVAMSVALISLWYLFNAVLPIM